MKTFLRVLCIVLVIPWVFILGPARDGHSGSGLAQIPEDQCDGGLFAMDPNFNAQGAWDLFEDFVVSHEGTRYRIVGDRIHLEPNRFAFLKRHGEDSITEVTELVIDALEI